MTKCTRNIGRAMVVLAIAGAIGFAAVACKTEADGPDGGAGGGTGGGNGGGGRQSSSRNDPHQSAWTGPRL